MNAPKLKRNFKRFKLCILLAGRVLLTFVRILFVSRGLTTSGSVEGLGFGAQSCADHLTVDGLDVWNLADHHWPILLLRRQSVDSVANQSDAAQVCKLGALGNLIPILDLVVGDVEGRELLKRRHVVKSLNLVVREPELLERGSDVLQVLDPLDVVAGEGKNFQILQALHWNDLLDHVRGEGKLLAVLELVDLVVQSFEWIGQLADEVDFSGLLGRDTRLLLPLADCFSKRDSRHVSF